MIISIKGIVSPSFSPSFLISRFLSMQQWNLFRHEKENNQRTKQESTDRQ